MEVDQAQPLARRYPAGTPVGDLFPLGNSLFWSWLSESLGVLPAQFGQENSGATLQVLRPLQDLARSEC